MRRDVLAAIAEELTGAAAGRQVSGGSPRGAGGVRIEFAEPRHAPPVVDVTRADVFCTAMQFIAIAGDAVDIHRPGDAVWSAVDRDRVRESVRRVVSDFVADPEVVV